MPRNWPSSLSLLLLCLALANCSVEPAPEQAAVSPERQERAQVTVLSEAQVIPGRRAAQREEISDVLYRALQAMDEDRLLTPPEDNAYTRFREVLDRDPDNAIALEGMENIVLRYVGLARDAAVQGLFDQAEIFLDRARFVDAGHPGIEEAVAVIESEQQSTDLFFDFETAEILARSDAAQDRLANIALQARTLEAFFLITAPSDDHARWMYSVMRDAVSGHRLRGTIEIAARYSVRLRLPEEQGS